MNTRLFATIAAMLLCTLSFAQNDIVVPEGYELVDSIIYRPSAVSDSSLVGRSIFSLMPDGVAVHQSQSIRTAVDGRALQRAGRSLNGYRVRIYFDNKQGARYGSESAMSQFKRLYPGIAAYRTFASPFFKVTVGDFRTKSEAMQLLEQIKETFPSAFVLKEKINFPVVDRNRAYIVDTVRVLRPVAVEI